MRLAQQVRCLQRSPYDNLIGVEGFTAKKYAYRMTLAGIKSAIEGLPEEEKTALITWLLSRDREDWDKQIAEDFSAGGRGAKLLEEVDAAIDRGDFKPLG